MKSDLQKAKDLLESSHNTCVLYQSGIVYTSMERGVKPLLDWLDDGTDLRGFSAADKVVGKAAAFLYVLLGVREVYAPVMSNGAVEVFLAYGITAEYDLLTDRIRNRSGTGFCPMEQAVMDVATPELAREAIINKRRMMLGKE